MFTLECGEIQKPESVSLEIDFKSSVKPLLELCNGVPAFIPSSFPSFLPSFFAFFLPGRMILTITLHYQLDWIWKYVRNTLLAMAMRAFHRASTGKENLPPEPGQRHLWTRILGCLKRIKRLSELSTRNHLSLLPVSTV